MTTGSKSSSPVALFRIKGSEIGPLVGKYRAKVRTRYGITEDIQGEITTEALTEKWMPG